jgi:hypothetical protein
MEQIKDGGPAFPHDDRARWGERSGMTLRAFIATKAMQGLLANPGGPIQQNDITGWGLTNTRAEGVAKTACAMADALIAELEKQS